MQHNMRYNRQDKSKTFSNEEKGITLCGYITVTHKRKEESDFVKRETRQGCH